MRANRTVFRVSAILATFACLLLLSATGAQTQSATYVGSDACADCHFEEHENFMKFSKKAHSGDSVRIMAPDLTSSELEECFQCHMTGFGRPGGFESFEATPELAHAGCEVCHGPGSLHVEEFGDAAYIKGDLEVSDCETCHNPERVASFDYKPLLFGGAH